MITSQNQIKYFKSCLDNAEKFEVFTLFVKAAKRLVTIKLMMPKKKWSFVNQLIKLLQKLKHCVLH